MIKILKKLHLFGAYKRLCSFLINHIFVSMKPFSSNIKSTILRSNGHMAGKGTTIVRSVYIIGNVEIGDACWVNRDFTIQGNGLVKIGNNCDIGHDASFLRGGHKIRTKVRRAGDGESCVVATCACVVHDISPSLLIGGVPAKVIRRLDGENIKPSEE